MGRTLASIPGWETQIPGTANKNRKQNKITTPREFVFQELGISTVFSWCHFANILMKVSVVVVQ